MSGHSKSKKMWSGQEYDLQTENRSLALNKEEMAREGFHYVDQNKRKRKTPGQSEGDTVIVKYSNYLLQMINLILFLRNNNLYVQGKLRKTRAEVCQKFKTVSDAVQMKV